MATFNTELARKGPGLLLRDLMRGEDEQISAVIATIAGARPDIIALQGFDYDLENAALRAFSDALTDQGLTLPHLYAAPPNAGRRTAVDLDGDGKTGGPGDAQGYGEFFGQGSMALLSRYPILMREAQDYSAILWRDLPDALLPEKAAGPFPSAEAQEIQRLSSHGHWVIPIAHPTWGRITLLTYHATPPVFDGPEDRNGRRNHDETVFWQHFLAGAFGTPPAEQFILLGDANLDPDRGDGRREAMKRLLAHSALQDPLPGTPTVNWAQTGPMRVDYVLPSADWTVTEAKVVPIDPSASRHSLVYVDVTRPSR